MPLYKATGYNSHDPQKAKLITIAVRARNEKEALAKIKGVGLVGPTLQRLRGWKALLTYFKPHIK